MLRPQRADAVGDKVRPILATTTPLPRRSSRKPNIEHDTPAWSIQCESTRPGACNGRIKKVHAKKVRAKIFRAPFGKLFERIPLVLEATMEPGVDVVRPFRKGCA